MNFKLSSNQYSLVLLLAVLAFVGFLPFFEKFENVTAQQFLAAAFGVVFSAIVLFLILKKQSEMEQHLKHKEMILKTKFDLYRSYINALSEIHSAEGGILSFYNEIRKKAYEVGLIATQEIFEANEKVLTSISQDDKVSFAKAHIMVLNLLRKDLGLNQALDIQTMDLIQDLMLKLDNQTKKEFDNSVSLSKKVYQVSVELFEKRKEGFSTNDVFDELLKLDSSVKRSTVSTILIGGSINHNSRKYYPSYNTNDYWHLGRGLYRLATEEEKKQATQNG